MKIRCYECGTERDSENSEWRNGHWMCWACLQAEYIDELVAIGEERASAASIAEERYADLRAGEPA